METRKRAGSGASNTVGSNKRLKSSHLEPTA
jgi:ribosome assembly protein 4